LSLIENEDRKKLNIIHQEQDRMSGRRPIEFIQVTRPIVIIDEPQSVDNTPKSKRAISNLNPLLCLRSSATHVNPYNLLYKLDPIQAYDLKLVKQIEVSSIEAETNFNQIFIRLDSISYPKNSKTPQAAITIHDDNKGSPKEKKIKVKQGTDISQKTNRSGYDGYIVSNICADKGAEYVEFSNGIVLELKQEKGGMGEEILKTQIYETIKKGTFTKRKTI
jgi:type III restriction enzyme